MNRTLYLLAEDFSNDTKECFFERELPYHCAAFEKVYVLSLYPNTNRVLKFGAPNLEVLHFDYFEPCNRVRIFSKHLFRILGILFFELTHTHRRSFYFKNLGKHLNQLVLQFSAAERFEKFIAKDIHQNTIFYTYWFKQWTVALSIIKQKHNRLKFVSRVHGGDYDEDQIKSVFPFRYFQLSKVDHIFPVSDYGKNYLATKFKMPHHRMTTARLGLAIKPKMAPVDQSHLHMVSCSSVIALKRVHLILEILNSIEMPCKWTHFGNGPLLEELKNKANSSRHSITFKGYVPNKGFIDFLSTNAVSLFINVSESEGIPVSMMEAIAHGIPLIGTKVCGVPEIVTEKTGFLFPVNFEPATVAKKIVEEHISGRIYDPGFRDAIIGFYEAMFFESNYKRLAMELSGI